jgi:hypothetical protein
MLALLLALNLYIFGAGMLQISYPPLEIWHLINAAENNFEQSKPLRDHTYLYMYETTNLLIWVTYVSKTCQKIIFHGSRSLRTAVQVRVASCSWPCV